MSKQVHFVKDVLNGVEIDRPINHELSTYLKGVGYKGNPMSKYDHAGAAIQSVKFKGIGYDDLPNFTVRFKVEFDSVQEIAANFWRFQSPAKIVDILDDGIIVEVEEALAGCSVDRTNNPVTYSVTVGGAEYPIECAFLKQVALEAGDFKKISDETHAEIEDMEHWCYGNIYEVAVAVVPVGAETATKVGEMAGELFGEDGDVDTNLFSMTDEEVRGELWDEPDLLEFVTAPDGTQYRVISNSHED